MIRGGSSGVPGEWVLYIWNVRARNNICVLPTERSFNDDGGTPIPTPQGYLWCMVPVPIMQITCFQVHCVIYPTRTSLAVSSTI